jgi:hypothetical protein
MPPLIRFLVSGREKKEETGRNAEPGWAELG